MRPMEVKMTQVKKPFNPGDRIELAKYSRFTPSDIPVGTKGVVDTEPPIGNSLAYCVVRFEGFEMRCQVHMDDLRKTTK